MMGLGLSARLLLLLLLSAVQIYSQTAKTTVPDLVDESQVKGLEEFLTDLEPDLRNLVISILTIYERARKEDREQKLRELMQQQPYELLDRLFDLYQKARRKEVVPKVSASEDITQNKYELDK